MTPCSLTTVVERSCCLEVCLSHRLQRFYPVCPQVFNATMTPEFGVGGSTDATLSHPWGTSAIPAIVHGVMGVVQTAPAWAEYAKSKEH